MDRIKELPTYLCFILLTLAACFAIGTVTHAIDIYRLGFFGYSKLPHVSLGLNIFWSSLIFLDFIVIVLLFTRQTYGIVLGFCVLFADVVINMIFIVNYENSSTLFSPAVALQLSALLFSLFTLPLWIGFVRGDRFKFYCKVFAFVPIVSFSYWFFLHSVGIVRLLSGVSPQTVWNFWTQFSMFFLDGFIIAALLNKTRIGFYITFIALILLSGEILVGAALTMMNIIATPIQLSAGVGLALSFLSVTALIMTKENYLKTTQGTKVTI
jgi:hypothetical protein